MKHPLIATGVVLLSGAGLFWMFASGAEAAEGGKDGSSPSSYRVETGDLRVTLTENGTLVAKESKNVKPKSRNSSKITYLIDEGTTVKEGDVVCRLETKELEQEVEQLELDIVKSKTELEQARTELEIQKVDNLSQVEKAELDLEKARKELEKYTEGERKQQRREKEIAIKDTETEFARKTKFLNDSKLLVEQKFLKESELEDHQLEYEKADVRLASAKLDLELWEKYTDPMTLADKQAAVRVGERGLDTAKKRGSSQISQKEVAVQQAEKSLKKLEERLTERREDLENMELTAPVPGIVVYGDPRNPWSRSEIRLGESVWRGTTIVTIPDLRVMQVKLKVHEADVNKVDEGQPVTVTMDTFPGEVLVGKVSKVAQIAGTRDRWGDDQQVKVFDVEITIDDLGELELKPGISAKAEIFIDEKKGVLFVPLQSVGLEEGESFCYVVGTDGKPHRRVIEVGISNENYIEVMKGLEAGEEVLLYNPQLTGGSTSGDADENAPAKPSTDGGTTTTTTAVEGSGAGGN